MILSVVFDPTGKVGYNLLWVLIIPSFILIFLLLHLFGFDSKKDLLFGISLN